MWIGYKIYISLNTVWALKGTCWIEHGITKIYGNRTLKICVNGPIRSLVSGNVWFYVPPKKLSFRLSFSLSDMTNYKSAFGKVCRIKNRHTFKSMPILNSAYFTECRRHIVIPCGKVCRIKNRHTFRILPILNSAYFKSMPILNSSYHAVKYAELRIGSILKVCRFVIRHITQTETQTETEANFTHGFY